MPEDSFYIERITRPDRDSVHVHLGDGVIMIWPSVEAIAEFSEQVDSDELLRAVLRELLRADPTGESFGDVEGWTFTREAPSFSAMGGG